MTTNLSHVPASQLQEELERRHQRAEELRRELAELERDLESAPSPQAPTGAKPIKASPAAAPNRSAQTGGPKTGRGSTPKPLTNDEILQLIGAGPITPVELGKRMGITSKGAMKRLRKMTEGQMLKRRKEGNKFVFEPIPKPK